MNDYSVRYASNYTPRVAAAHRQHKRIAGGLCCCCMKEPAEEIHHTEYGNDKYGVNWFPVCKKCHDTVCHHKSNWIRLKGKEAELGNHNTEAFTSVLRRNYKTLVRKKLFDS